MKTKVGLIRVLTTEDKALLNLHGNLVMSYCPELDVASACIPDQPEGIHDDATEEIAVPKVLALAEKMEKDGVKAVIISCAGDPAFTLASEKLSIPVIGAGRAAAYLARTLEQPTAVLGITDKAPPAIRLALGEYFVGEIVPQGVDSTLDLMKEQGMQAVLAAGEKLVSQGAKVIVLACTGLATIGAAKKLREKLRVPVIDPVHAQALVCAAALGPGGE
ncbi:MAG: aspartate/glutamate racemase family protein [Fusobacteriaceae bacterium]|jgi:Asp/Glu/hydantoin racemase|nr:aspartate/glutamate racemase family protein [Fusobacteriaceae bacterium]